MWNYSEKSWDAPRSSEPHAQSRADITAGLTPAQAAAAADDGAILVLAGAGIAKMRTLTAGVALRIAKQGIQPDQIDLLTSGLRKLSRS